MIKLAKNVIRTSKTLGKNWVNRGAWVIAPNWKGAYHQIGGPVSMQMWMKLSQAGVP